MKLRAGAMEEVSGPIVQSLGVVRGFCSHGVHRRAIGTVL